ncbi:hypothetical protein ACFQY4_14075 [Catellatospora bangladeshensis]|uniref:beta-xylosidase family glycoside hydrolase n=1 Tax=Catellatospora bangladeshensis TaxID=310355 RepID=UPI00361EE269
MARRRPRRGGPPGAAMAGPARARAPRRDDFDSPRLHPQWISVRSRPEDLWSLTEPSGWLTLHARGASLDQPDVMFVGRRQQHLSCTVRTLLDATAGRGGLAARLDEAHHYEIEAGDGRVQVSARASSLRTVLGDRAVAPGPVLLRMDVIASPSAHWQPCREPDTIRLGVEHPDGTFEVLAELDGRYLSTEVAGGFTGRVLGMYAAAGTVRFDWFDYAPIEVGSPTSAEVILAP